MAAAFESVPRHVFVPRFFDDSNEVVDGSDPAQQGTWLDAVYADTSLITQLTKVPGQDLLWPTSSSTMPSLMASMLGLLNVNDGDTAAEIGFGTGYNFTIMTERLGSDRTTSIDIDPGLIEEGRKRVESLGYAPRLVAGDGVLGIPDYAPYNGIVATCAVPAVSGEWISQLDRRGTIVADIRSDLSSALVTLNKISADVVQGRFLSVPGYFMWLRAKVDNPLRDGGSLDTTTDMTEAEESVTKFDPVVLDDPDLRFMLTLTVPGIKSMWSMDSDDGPMRMVRFDDGSWVEIPGQADIANTRRVVEGGTGRRWAQVEEAASHWASIGRPDRARFGLTASADGSHAYWLDDPGRPVQPIAA